MACQLECSCSVSLRKRKSEVLSPDDDDVGVPKLKRMRSSLRIASRRMTDELTPNPTFSRAESIDKRGQKRVREEDDIGEGSTPPAKKRRVASMTEEEKRPEEAMEQDETNEVVNNVQASPHTEMEDDGVSEVKKDALSAGEPIALGSEPAAVTNDAPADDEELGAVGGVTATGTDAGPVLDERFESDWELICEVHPDCDPVYIREQLTVLINDPQRVSTVTFDIYANENYPKRADREYSDQLRREREELMNMPLELETFHKKYPDPMAVFNVLEGEVTEHYYDHAEVYLKNLLPWIQVNVIKKTLRQSGFHLTPAYMKLKPMHDAHEHGAKGKKTRARKSTFRLYPRSEQYEYPEEADVDFYWEKLFLSNMDKIIEYTNALKEARQMRLEVAKADGNLHDCPICLEADVFEEDMIHCDGGHLFCLECVRKYAEERIGQGRSTFPCLDGNCTHEFALHSLELALTTQMYSLAVRTIQAAQLRDAEIEHLETCPFCPYAVIIPYENTATLFHCENPDCMQDSCRKCKEVSHVPFRCSEFKSMKDVTMRTFVENQMAEAMIRNCPKCGLRFFKEEGCNHMRCSTCGTSTCYVCREIITGYQHFRKNPKCSQYTDSVALHRTEVTEAYKGSTDLFKERHPEFGSINLNIGYNPIEVLAM